MFSPVGLLNNKLFLGGAAAVFFAGCITLGWTAGVAKHDANQAQTEVTRLTTEIQAPVTGYIARLAACDASLSGARISIDSQNTAIDEVIRSSAEAKARAEARIKAAEERALVAQRKIEDLRNFQPVGDETQCEAAFRLHQETAR